MDTASVYLFQEGCTGQTGKEVKIHLVSTGSPGQTYLEYTLVSGYSIDRRRSPGRECQHQLHQGGDEVHPAGGGNETGSPVTKGYDLVTTKAV